MTGLITCRSGTRVTHFTNRQKSFMQLLMQYAMPQVGIPTFTQTFLQKGVSRMRERGEEGTTISLVGLHKFLACQLKFFVHIFTFYNIFSIFSIKTVMTYVEKVEEIFKEFQEQKKSKGCKFNAKEEQFFYTN